MVGTMSYISWHHRALYRASENHLLIMTAPLPDPVNKYFFNPYHTPDPLPASGYQWGVKRTSSLLHDTYIGWRTEQRRKTQTVLSAEEQIITLQ